MEVPREFLNDIEEYKRLSAIVEEAEGKIDDIRDKFQKWMINNNEVRFTIADRVVQLRMCTKYKYDEEGIKSVLKKKNLWDAILDPNWKKLNNLIKGKLLKEEEIKEFITMEDGTPYIVIFEKPSKEEIKQLLQEEK